MIGNSQSPAQFKLMFFTLIRRIFGVVGRHIENVFDDSELLDDELGGDGAPDFAAHLTTLCCEPTTTCTPRHIPRRYRYREPVGKPGDGAHCAADFVCLRGTGRAPRAERSCTAPTWSSTPRASRRGDAHLSIDACTLTSIQRSKHGTSSDSNRGRHQAAHAARHHAVRGWTCRVTSRTSETTTRCSRRLAPARPSSQTCRCGHYRRCVPWTSCPRAS